MIALLHSPIGDIHRSFKPGMSNSNYLAGRKCTKNLQKGHKIAQKSQVGQILQNIMIENAFTYVLFGSFHVLVLKIVHIGKESKIMGKKIIFSIMKIPIRAAQNKQRGRMRPAGRQFDMPALSHRFSAQTTPRPAFLKKKFHDPQLRSLIIYTFSRLVLSHFQQKSYKIVIFY